jgi:hypothetical protein
MPKHPLHPPPDALTPLATNEVTYHNQRQAIPVIKLSDLDALADLEISYHNQRPLIPMIKQPVSDLEALEFVRGQMSALGAANAHDAAGHPLYSRALSELDRLIDHARQGSR